MLSATTLSNSAEHNTYPWEEYDTVVDPVMRLAGESMGGFMDAMKSYIAYTAAQNTPGAKESGVGYYYDNKTGRMKRMLFYRFGQGYPRQTGRPLDLKIDGTGVFCIELPGGWVGYTHDGRFEIDDEGRLAMQAHPFPVLGENGYIYLSDEKVLVDDRGVIYQKGEIVDTLRIEWVKRKHDLQSFNQTIYYLSKEDFDRGDRLKEPDYRILQGFIEESTTTKAYIGLVPEWKTGHESQVKVIKQYMKSMSSAISQADPR